MVGGSKGSRGTGARPLGASGTSDGPRAGPCTRQVLRGLKGVTCPQGAWLGGPRSWPDGRLAVGACAQGSHARLRPAESATSHSWACDTIRGLDPGWDRVPSQSLSTSHGQLAGRVRSLWLAGKGSGSHKPSSSLPRSPAPRPAGEATGLPQRPPTRWPHVAQRRAFGPVIHDESSVFRCRCRCCCCCCC